MSEKTVERIRNIIKEVDYNNANVEAEKGETIITTLFGITIPEHYRIEGKKHKDGGTPLRVPEGSFVFSDSPKMVIKDENVLKLFNERKQKTPAQIAKKYDLNKYKAILIDKETSSIDKVTAALMLKNNYEKLAMLALYQESMKGFRDGIPEFARPFMEQFHIDENVIKKIKEKNLKKRMDVGGTFGDDKKKRLDAIIERIKRESETNLKPEDVNSTFTFTRPGENISEEDINYIREGLKKSGLDLVDYKSITPRVGNTSHSIQVKRSQPSNDIKSNLLQSAESLVSASVLPGVPTFTDVFEFAKFAGTISNNKNNNTNNQQQQPNQDVNNNNANNQQQPDQNVNDNGKFEPFEEKTSIKDILLPVNTQEPELRESPLNSVNIPDTNKVIPDEEQKQKKEKINSILQKFFGNKTFTIGGPDELVRLKSSSLWASKINQDLANISNQRLLNADNVFLPVKGIDRGDYSVAGTTYGQFRPGEQTIKYTDAMQPLFSKEGGNVGSKIYNWLKYGGGLKKYPEGGNTDIQNTEKRKKGYAGVTDSFLDKNNLNFDVKKENKNDQNQNILNLEISQNKQKERKGYDRFYNFVPDIEKSEAFKRQLPETNFLKSPENLNTKIDVDENKSFKEAIRYWIEGRYKKSENENESDKPKKTENETSKKENEVPFKEKAPYAFSSQDVRNIAGAIAQMSGIKKYLPWSPPVDYYIPRTVYYDPTREIQAAATTAASIAKGLGTYTSPQIAAANMAERQAMLADQVANIVSNANRTNISLANQAEQQKSGIYNQAAATERARQQDLYDKTVVANQQYDDATRKALAGYIAAINKAEENAATLYNLSNYALSNSPYYYDPVTGVIKYDPERGKFDKGKKPEQDQIDKFREAYNRFKEMNLPDDVAQDYAARISGIVTTGNTALRKNKKSEETDNKSGKNSDIEFKVGDKSYVNPQAGKEDNNEEDNENENNTSGKTETQTKGLGGQVYDILFNKYFKK